jgi:hypothetical protein
MPERSNLKEERFQRFQPMLSWLLCCGPEVRQNIMVGQCVVGETAHLMAARLGERQTHRNRVRETHRERQGRDVAPKGVSPRTKPFNGLTS